MPITIQLEHVALIAGTLSAHASNLGSDIKATLHGNHLRLWQGQAPVFEIRVDIQGKNVTLNRAETPVLERGRGWG
ncbi:MAG TPA: hypothetical protein VFQ61_17405, partial [Polyangiaceae bacterium]|nr:hypothetical protein [Polyangiaceae bacterium]